MVVSNLIIIKPWAGEMSERLRTPSVLPEDLALFPNVHIVYDNSSDRGSDSYKHFLCTR